MNTYTLGFDLYWDEKANEILKTNQYLIKPYDKTYLYFYQISIFMQTDGFIKRKQYSSMYDCFLYTTAYNRWSEHLGTSWDIETFKDYFKFNVEISEQEAHRFLSMSPKKIITLKELTSQNITNHIYKLKEEHPEWFI